MTLAVVTLLLFGWAISRADRSPHLYGFFVLFLINVWARQLQNLLGTSSLPERLRAAEGTPQFRFVTITAADFTTLLLSLAALSHWESLDEVGTEGLLELIPDLLGSDSLGAVFEARKGPWTRLLTVASGVLLVASMLKTLFDRQAFTRQPRDFAGLAVRAIAIGDHEAAREWLSRTDEAAEEVLFARCVYYLSIGEFDRCLVYARREVLRRRLEPTRENDFVCVGAALCFVSPDAERAGALLQFAIQRQVPDRILSSLAMIFIKVQGVPVASLVFSSTAIAATIAELASGEPLETMASYPLTVTGLLIQDGRYEAARSVLASMRPGSVFEEAMRRCLLLHAKVEVQSFDLTSLLFAGWREGFERWVVEDWPELLRLLPDLEKCDEEERKLVLRELIDARGFSRLVRSPVRKELEASFQRLQRSLTPSRMNRNHQIVLDRLGV